MSNKSQFLKSAKLAIAGVALVTTLGACRSNAEKHVCGAKNGCAGSGKIDKANSSVKADKKDNCSSSKMEKGKCSAKKSQ